MQLLRDLWTLAFLRDVLCEFAGTAFLVFAGLAPATAPRAAPDCRPPDLMLVSLAFGASIALASLCLGPASSVGVHLNPAVTLALLAGLRVSLWRAVLYVGAQLLGASCACALLLGVAPQPLCGPVGVNEIAAGVSSYQAFAVEMAVTFQLVLCVFVTVKPSSPDPHDPPCPLLGPATVGLSVTLGHLVAMGFTGCGMNPARSFGPAMLALNFHHHWVYWAGPLAGAALAGVLHDLVLYPRWGSASDWLAEFRRTFLKPSPSPQCG